MGGTRAVRFTAEEDAFLRKNYKAMGPAACAQKMGRNCASCRSRAQKLEIVVKKPRTVKRYAQALRAPEAPRPVPQCEALTPFPVSPAAAALAQFDKVVARVVREKRLGLPPGQYHDLRYAGHE